MNGDDDPIDPGGGATDMGGGMFSGPTMPEPDDDDDDVARPVQRKRVRKGRTVKRLRRGQRRG